MVPWLSGTVVVLALVLALGQLARWVMKRTHSHSADVALEGTWKVAPDARVRSLRVFGHVYWLYERGRETTLLASDAPGGIAVPKAMPAAAKAARAVAGS